MRKQILAIAALSFGTAAALAQNAEGPPRGRDIDSTAGNCNIGVFEQTAKAGSYNSLCMTMTDSEKCLALIKGQLHLQFIEEPGQPTSEGYKFFPARGHKAEIVTYCLAHLRAQLLPQNQTGE